MTVAVASHFQSAATSVVGHSRQGRAASKLGHARYAAESGSKFRAASQLMHLVKVARA
jgi:hypothetical protein